MARAKSKAKAKPKAKPKAKAKAKRRGTPVKSPKLKRKLAAAKGAATRKIARERELESQRASEQAEYEKLDADERARVREDRKEQKRAKARARQLATRAVAGGRSVLGQLEDALGRMKARAPFAVGLKIENSPVYETGTNPWLLLGSFKPRTPRSWAHIGRMFAVWEDDLTLHVMIHPRRTTLIRITYDQPEKGHATSGYSPVKPGSWDNVISECRRKLIGGDWTDPDEDSIAAKYENTRVLFIDVLFSANT